MREYEVGVTVSWDLDYAAGIIHIVRRVQRSPKRSSHTPQATGLGEGLAITVIGVGG